MSKIGQALMMVPDETLEEFEERIMRGTHTSVPSRPPPDVPAERSLLEMLLRSPVEMRSPARPLHRRAQEVSAEDFFEGLEGLAEYTEKKKGPRRFGPDLQDPRDEYTPGYYRTPKFLPKGE